MIHHLLARYAGYGIGFVIVVLLRAFRSSPWLKQAHRLAAKSDIALPAHLEWQVARFLRGRYIVGALSCVLFVPPLVSVMTWPFDSRTFPAAFGRPVGWIPWYPALVAALPLFWVGFSVLVAAWPRWRASGRGRVAHLGVASSPVEAFTPGEIAALVLGALGTVALGAWGLERLHAPVAWWALCAGGYTAALAAWWYAAAAAMNRPSNASDIVELGWDDMLRFNYVRALTASAAWFPAVLLLLLDTMMSLALGNSQSVSFWPLYVMAAVATVVYQVFRQGRHRWRRAWDQRM